MQVNTIIEREASATAKDYYYRQDSIGSLSDKQLMILNIVVCQMRAVAGVEMDGEDPLSTFDRKKQVEEIPMSSDGKKRREIENCGFCNRRNGISQGLPCKITTCPNMMYRSANSQFIRVAGS